MIKQYFCNENKSKSNSDVDNTLKILASSLEMFSKSCYIFLDKINKQILRVDFSVPASGPGLKGSASPISRTASRNLCHWLFVIVLKCGRKRRWTVREFITHIRLIPKEILLKSFLDNPWHQKSREWLEKVNLMKRTDQANLKAFQPRNWNNYTKRAVTLSARRLGTMLPWK